MHKKFIIFFSLFLFHYAQQFTMFRHVATALQRNSLLEINSAFTNEFLRLSSRSNHSILQVSLLSQIPLDTDLEDRILKLAVEDCADIRILVSKKVAEIQKDTLAEMQKEEIEVEVLPESYAYINWQERYAKNHALNGFKITNNKNIPSSMIAALILYSSGQNIMLLGKPRETFSLYDHKDYAVWQKKFDALFLDL